MPARGNIRVHGNRAAVGALATLVCALIALAAIPAVAAARTITVDSTGDQPGAGLCAESAPAGECTLRAAIQASNTDSTFDQIQFDGVQGEELEPESALPALIRPVQVSGSLEFNGSYYAPEVGITAPSGAAALTVDADDVIVEGLALGGGTAGIEVVGESTGLLARGNWLGLKLDTEANESTVAGIVLRPGSDAAEIGSKENEATRRNVFGNDEVGILVEGASETKILGNYIGIGPDGDGPATLGVGVRIVDGPAAPAEHNEVGGKLTKVEAKSTVCDGPCNVIATDGGTDIDLTGEEAEPASGPTTIRGNYLGLVADGLSPVGENSSGVVADPGQFPCGGGPGDVTVGGTAPTEGNYIDAGSFGIFAEGAENFRALGNSIGFLADGSPGESPIAFGIEVCAEGVTEPAQISNNDMLLGPGAIAGIVSEWGRAEISGNTVHGGQIGVLTGADSEGHGDLIKGNTVTAPELDGIQIQSQSNTVIGNVIRSAGEAGINLQGGDLNRVGGDLAGEANSIEGSGVGAILISGSEATRDEVRGNTGSGNAGAFIQLLEEGEPGERPNAAVEPPTVATSMQSSASGTAKPGAMVRIFSKASAEPGELASLLAVVPADPMTGVWNATYATVPVGTLVAATETSTEGATSEVSEPRAATADPVKPVEPEEHDAGAGSAGSSSSGSNSSNPPIPAKAPKVKFTKRPRKTSKSTTAQFKFKAIPAAGAKFQCKLDNAKWVSCKSPKTYKHLKPRRHTFQVRASASGVTSPAAKFKFTVKR